GGIAQVRFATGAKSSGQVFNVTSSGVGVIQTAAASTGTPQSTNGIAGTSDYTQGVRVVTSADTNQNEVLVTVASTVAGTQTLTYTAINATTLIFHSILRQEKKKGPPEGEPFSLLAISYSATASSANGVTGGTTGNQAAVMIFSDGTAGKATITVKSGDVTLATKTVIFYGTVAKLTATQNLFIAPATAAGGTLGCGTAGCTWLTVATTPAVYISATDSAGNVVPGLVITMVSDNTNVISSATIAEDNATAGDGPGYYNAAVTSPAGGTSGASTKVRFRTLLSSGAFVTSDDVTFTLGGALATGTLALNKSSYAPGEAMIVTRTAKDASGNAVYDGVASPAVAFTKAVGGTIPLAGEFINGSSATSTSRPSVFAPATSGAFEARATYTNATTAARTQVAATASVTDDAATAAANAASDAAAEAIDAANAATDAANLAAEAADAATVAAEE
ncbi:MAG: hypothetical protein EBW14_17885, partial [Oxalobacteraceae bacterium]|nr:hypothetical protein [Oxalobacteraceae bacterium]